MSATDDTGENVMGTPRRVVFVPAGAISHDDAEQIKRDFLASLQNGQMSVTGFYDSNRPRIERVRDTSPDVSTFANIKRGADWQRGWPWAQVYVAVMVEGRRVWARRKWCLTGYAVAKLLGEMAREAQRRAAGAADHDDQR